MSSDRRKNRLLFDNNIEEMENMKTIYEFDLQITVRYNEYESPEFVLQGTDLRCRVMIEIIHKHITFCLHIKDNYENVCVEKPRFEEILWFNDLYNYNEKVNINKKKPTVPLNVDFYRTVYRNCDCKVTVTYKIKNYEFISDGHLTMHSNLQYMYEDEEFTDVIINVEGEEFSAHKVLLVRNPVFAAVFRNDMQESKENIIYIKKMDPVVFQIILRYLYLGNTGKIYFKKLGEDFLINLIVATDMYQMENLNAELMNIAVRYLNQSNVIQLFKFADRHNYLEVKEKIMLYIKNYQKEIFDSLPFKELIKENPKLTSDLLLYVMQK